MHRIDSSKVLSAVAFAALMACSGAAAAGPVGDGKLRIYNWADYVAEDTLANFEAETGLEVIYDTFDSDETLQTRLLAGSTGFDIVVPGSAFATRLQGVGIFRKLDPATVTNRGNLDKEYVQRILPNDPASEYFIPYETTTTGIAYDALKLDKLAPNAPRDSWALLFDPANAEQLAECGIAMIDAPSEVLQIALNYLGLDPVKASEADLAKAEALLAGIRPHVRYFDSSRILSDLVSGEICIALTWTGEAFLARARAQEAYGDASVVDIRYVIPKEGTLLQADVLAIPADAPNPEAANLFINYILRPDVHAAITNYTWYGNANKAALEFIDPEIKGDASIFPSPEVLARLWGHRAFSSETERLMTRAWTRFKTNSTP